MHYTNFQSIANKLKLALTKHFLRTTFDSFYLSIFDREVTRIFRKWLLPDKPFADS